MTLREHLEELRSRILICLAAAVAGFIMFFAGSERLLETMILEAGRYDYTVMVAAPADGLAWQLKLGTYAAVFACMPVFIWNIIRFIEGQTGFKGVFGSLMKTGAVMGLMLGGALAGKSLLLPFTLSFLKESASGIDGLRIMVTLKEYLRLYLCMISLGAVTALMPAVLYLLALSGIVTYDGMKEKQRIFVVAAFVAAAVITPPDVMTQIIAGTMLILFYRIGMFTVKCSEKRKNDKTKERRKEKACTYRSGNAV